MAEETPHSRRMSKENQDLEELAQEMRLDLGWCVREILEARQQRKIIPPNFCLRKINPAKLLP
jgi:hypothetical protein